MTNPIDRLKLLTEAPSIFDREEEAHAAAIAQIGQARRIHRGIIDAFFRDELPWSAAVAQTEDLLAGLGRTVEAPEGSPGRKARGPDKAPRQRRTGIVPSSGSSQASKVLALSDADRDVLRSALESYGPLTLLALSEAFTVHKLTPLGMPLEDALTSTDDFCSWRVETGSGPDLWGTLNQFEAACNRRFGPLRDASWIDGATAVSKLMDLTGCGAMAARRVLDMAIERRVAMGTP